MTQNSSPVESRPELPPLPEKMRNLHVDRRGYPVPWFVAWLTGDEGDLHEVAPGTPGSYPEFRVMSQRRLHQAMEESRCWVCGGKLGRFKAFTIGPMCAVNRINSEPSSHLSCAEYAATACPFLSRPHMRRRDENLPEGHVQPAGIGIMRNPQACAVWLYEGIASYRLVPRSEGDGEGVLFSLPEPRNVLWFAKGRSATREEVVSSLESGMPELEALCRTDADRLDVAGHLLELDRWLPRK